MTQQQTDNIKLISDSLTKYGITNPNLQAGILATISKESNFIPQSENLNYSVANIKRVWSQIPDATAQTLANNPVALGNYQYGNKGGNGATDGYTYRGRGFNQITFKGTYQKIGDTIGVDLVSNPDALNDPQVAADAAAAFFAGELKAGFGAGSFNKFGATSPDTVNDTLTATKIAVQINAGRGTNFNNPVVQEGFNKAKGVVDSLYDTIKSYTPNVVLAGAGEAEKGAKATAEIVKKNPLTTILIVSGMLLAFVVIIRTIKKNKTT